MAGIKELKNVNLEEVDQAIKSEITGILSSFDKLSESKQKEFIELESDNINDLYDMVKTTFPNALISKQELEKKKKEKEPKPKKKLSKQELEACHNKIAELEKQLEQYQKKKPPKKKRPISHKRTSTVLADNTFKAISGAVRKEFAEKDVVHLKPKEIATAKELMVKALKHLRKGLGGIEDDNDSFIKRFEKNMNKLIEEIEKMQHEIEYEKKS